MASRRIINYKLIIRANISVIWVIFAFLSLYNIILDLVYSGDTLNTTARIRSKVNEIGEMEFKGKAEKEKLFSVIFE
jgi:hypothetical protein